MRVCVNESVMFILIHQKPLVPLGCLMSFESILASCDRYRLTAFGSGDSVADINSIWGAITRKVKSLFDSGKVSARRMPSYSALSTPCVCAQIAVIPQFFKVGKNLDTGAGVFVLADEFGRFYGVTATKPPGCKQVLVLHITRSCMVAHTGVARARRRSCRRWMWGWQPTAAASWSPLR